MRLTCPACQAEFSLDVAIGRDEDARALADLLQRFVPLHGHLVRYLALFRPAKRRLSFARTVVLLTELQPDLARAAITRKGRDWAAPPAVWQSAIDQVLAARDKGTLVLPLTGHGYLFEVMVAHADKAEAAGEREALDAARKRTPAAAAAGDAVAVGNALASSAGAHVNPPAPAPAAPPPYDPARGPSRSARETKARMEAAQKLRAGHADDTGDQQ